MFDASVFAPAPSYEDPFYDMEAHQFVSLDPGRLNAHINSMKHSQKADYGKKLRYVVTSGLFKGGNPMTLASYNVPGIDTAMKVADEVVIRPADTPGKEVVIKGEGLGLRDIAGAMTQSAPPAASTPAPAVDLYAEPKRRPLDI